MESRLVRSGDASFEYMLSYIEALSITTPLKLTFVWINLMSPYLEEIRFRADAMWP